MFLHMVRQSVRRACFSVYSTRTALPWLERRSADSRVPNRFSRLVVPVGQFEKRLGAKVVRASGSNGVGQSESLDAAGGPRR